MQRSVFRNHRQVFTRDMLNLEKAVFEVMGGGNRTRYDSALLIVMILAIPGFPVVYPTHHLLRGDGFFQHA